jgi:enamine deaminase RidA (YjgF/YER057c/UK114 family)
MRKNFSSGAKWEDIVGYSRAVQIGNQLEVTGTVAVDENGTLIGRGDFFRQTEYALQKIERVVQQAGFSMADVIRTRDFCYRYFSLGRGWKSAISYSLEILSQPPLW